jgi:protein-S-isoprenylcysteine O-methyltransferase Ste14
MNTKSEMSPQELKALKKKVAVRFSAIPIFLGLILFLSAGTLNYWQAVLYLAVLTVPMVFAVRHFFRTDPKFLERRTRPKEKEKSQVAIALLSTVPFVSSFVVPGLDRRWTWSHVPTFLVIAADIVAFLGYLLILSVFKQNSFASRIVEVDESQKVITTGLYRAIRHPMYLGVLIMFLPAPIALGSYWALIPMVLLPPTLILRILDEERVLSRDLPGYDEYRKKTRFRLIPFVW